MIGFACARNVIMLMIGNNLKFSCVIPSYGQVEYLNDAIASAVLQTIPCEVIVVDDGSQDGSLDIAKKWGNQIKLIQQVNKGLASARNTGILNSTADYQFFLDADDVMLSTCIERINEVAEKTHADVISPSIHCFGLAEQDVILMENPTFDDFKEGNRLAYCSAIKRSALLETGGYSPKMDALGGYEDLHLWLDLLSRGKKIVTIQEILVLYRTKENSMYTEASKPEKHARLMNQLFKDFPDVWKSKEEQDAVRKQYPRR